MIRLIRGVHLASPANLEGVIRRMPSIIQF